MTGRTPPPPRSGRLTAGGPNSLELLWALLLLGAVAAGAIVVTIAWTALWAEAQLAGTIWIIGFTDMPGLLLELAGGTRPAAIDQTVAAPWRPATIAALLTVIATAAAAWGLRAWGRWQAGWRHRQRLHDRTGSHVWARRRDLTRLTAPPPRRGADEPPAAGRLWVGSHHGRDILVPAATSVMAVAPTRTGKSTRLVVPNLLRWDGPAVVTSVKRDVHDLTVARRHSFGPTMLFDPTGATGLASVRWSPLLSSTTFPDATKTATWLADAAAVEDRHEAAKFWETLATKLLAPLLFAAANTRKTIIDVSHWVDRSAFRQVADILKDLGDDDATAAWQAIADLPHETRGSVLGTAMAIFRAFGSPRVRQAASCTPEGKADDILDIPALLRDNGTLYLVSPEYEQTELRPLFVALVQAIYRAAVDISANRLGGAPLNPPLLLMLDEAGNIAPLQVLPKIAATGAGQGITLMTIWQDRSQIRELYRDTERTLISNHTTTIWLPGSQDLDTLKLLSDLIGDQWVASTNISAAPDGGLSISEGSERIDVAPPGFLRTLPHGTAVMLNGNTPPALIATHAYYEQHRWKNLIDRSQLHRYRKMHTGTGPTTADAWKDTDSGTEQLRPSPAARSGQPRRPSRRSSGIGRRLHAKYPNLPSRPDPRRTWGPGGNAIPDHLSTAPATWPAIRLPPDLASRIGAGHADLAEPRTRRQVLPLLLEIGPAPLIAATLTLPQLRDEWPHLDLTGLVRQAWEQSYPELADDVSAQPVAL